MQKNILPPPTGNIQMLPGGGGGGGGGGGVAVWKNGIKSRFLVTLVGQTLAVYHDNQLDAFHVINSLDAMQVNIYEFMHMHINVV